jgi:hypothetical protein
MREIDFTTLEKFEQTLNSYNEFENINSTNIRQWNELRSISIEKLINNQDIDDIWLEKAKIVDEKLPLEACLIWNKYLNTIEESISIDIEKYKVFGMISYIGMGWAIIFSIKWMFDAIGPVGFALLLGGGVLYTGGVLFFKAGKTKKYFHSIFHIFVLLGSISHLLCVLFFAM